MDSNLYLLVQSQPSCRLDDPEVRILDFRFWIVDWKRSLLPAFRPAIQNLKSKMAKTEGLEPSTTSFEARSSDSIELRLRKIEKVHREGFEPSQLIRTTVLQTACLNQVGVRCVKN